VRDAIFLKLTPGRGSLKHPKGGKLSSRYIGPFLITGLTSTNNVFHVSQLKKYNPNPENVLNNELLQLYSNLSFVEKPMKILE
jgi:hypothetical protein